MRKKLICCFATVMALVLSIVFVGNAEDTPEVGEVFFQGVTIVGRSLYGNYTNKTAEGEMTYKWLRGETKKGEYTPIDGAVSRSYLLTDDDAGMYIKFELTHQKTDGTVEVTSTDGYPVTAESTPQLNDVKLHGEGKSNEQLWVEYHFSDANGEPERNSYFKWQVSDDGVKFEYIDDELKQSFVPTDKYVGKYIRVSIRADKLGSTEKNSLYNVVSSAETFSEAVLISAKPTAEKVSVSSGNAYKGIYTYKISNNTNEGASKYFWEISDCADGKYEVISRELNLKKIQTDKNVYLRFSVIPVSSDGIEGDKISSQPILIEKNTEDGYARVSYFQKSDVDLKFVTPRTVEGMILHIKGNADDVEIQSSQFDVSKVKENGIYIFTFLPKANSAVYADDVIGVCSVTNNQGISIEKVHLFEYGDNNAYIADDSPVTFDVQPVLSNQTFQRTVHHYSDKTDTMAMVVAVFDRNGNLVRFVISEEKTLTGYQTETFSVTCEYDDTQTVKSYMFDIDTLKPYIKDVDISNGYVFDNNKTNFKE